MRLSGRLVAQLTPPGGVCVEQIASIISQTSRIEQNDSQTVRVDIMACCVQKLDLCLPQGAAKTFAFQDAETVDFSTATEITVDIWQGGIGGTSLLSVSLTGGQITLATDYRYQFKIGNATSAALPAGRHYCETWVTLASGDRRLTGAGTFSVINTRKFDA